MTDHLPNQSTAPEIPSSSNDKPVIIGLYGIPGSGKTFILKLLKQELGQDHLEFYEGSKMIANLVPGGLDAFQGLEEVEKVHWRQLAMDTIGKEWLIAHHFAGRFRGKQRQDCNRLVQHNRSLHFTIRIVLVAGVVQAQSVYKSAT